MKNGGEKLAQDSVQMLQATANQILATVAPKSARFLRARVLLETDAETAKTDGTTKILMPSTFCGTRIPDNQAVSVGLLAHEVSHFLQPLTEVNAVQQKEKIPHWLVNLVLDIQGESLLEHIFPALREPLTATRRVVHKEQLAGYRQSLAAATSFVDAAGTAALLGRFIQPSSVFETVRVEEFGEQPFCSKCIELNNHLYRAKRMPAMMLTQFLKTLIKRFPELRDAIEPQIPMGAPQVNNHLGADHPLLDEIQENVGGWGGGKAAPIRQKRYQTVDPSRDAQQLARRLQTRFAAPKSAIQIVAADRFDRREAARGGVPFRMALPGSENAALRVLLCVDVSSSMNGAKQQVAALAAQALALAIAQADGEVVGLLFDGAAAVDKSESDAGLFADQKAQRNRGGTSFTWLTEAWRRWSHHQLLILTDGCGEMPNVLIHDRERTTAIVIPDGDPDAMTTICARVVELDDLSRLPSLMAMLVPRTTTA